MSKLEPSSLAAISASLQEFTRLAKEISSLCAALRAGPSPRDREGRRHERVLARERGRRYRAQRGGARYPLQAELLGVLRAQAEEAGKPLDLPAASEITTPEAAAEVLSRLGRHADMGKVISFKRGKE